MLAIDGDTVVSQGQSYRLVGFNAPEVRSACPAEQQLAQMAKARLQKIIEGGAILVRVLCGRGYATDRHGRFCGRLITLDGADAADILIGEALAEPYNCGVRCPKRRNWCP